ncbi:MAG: hypothetical protein FWE88_01780 [Phycisphaerae bacterium]|nr:hypothetical protein [Phycisphaerae bacterium]
MTIATVPTLAASDSDSHAASTAARCGSVAATTAANTVSFTVSGSGDNSQVFD